MGNVGIPRRPHTENREGRRVENPGLIMAGTQHSERSPATTHVMSRAQRLKAFKDIIKLWPDRIDTSEKKYLPDNGCFIPTLNEAWNNAETLTAEKREIVGQDVFEETSTVLWLSFICLSAIAYHKDVVFPPELTFDQIDDIYLNGHPLPDQYV